MCKQLCASVRASRVEACCLALRWRSRAEHLAGRRLIEPGFQAKQPDNLKQSKSSYGGDVTSVFGNIETDSDVALRSQVINFIRPNFTEEPDKTAGVR